MYKQNLPIINNQQWGRETLGYPKPHWAHIWPFLRKIITATDRVWKENQDMELSHPCFTTIRTKRATTLLTGVQNKVHHRQHIPIKNPKPYHLIAQHTDNIDISSKFGLMMSCLFVGFLNGISC